MKRIYIAIAFIFSALGASAASLDALWDEGNTAYINADYSRAIQCYDSIIATGNVSYKLYYNLGNAHFKEGKIGPSILNYNRALKLAPSNSDVKYNLKIANSYVKDKIDQVPEFFLESWVHALRGKLSSNGWAALSIVMFALGLTAILFFLLSQKMSLRKTGFYVAIAALGLFIVSVIFSVVEKREILSPSQAIIMRNAAPIKSSPDNASRDIFILHEGTKVEIVGSLNDWREIVIADGNKGWILAASIETI